MNLFFLAEKTGLIPSPPYKGASRGLRLKFSPATMATSRRVILVPTVAIDCEGIRKFFSLFSMKQCVSFENILFSKRDVPFLVSEICSEQALEALSMIKTYCDWFSYDRDDMKALKKEACSLISTDIKDHVSLEMSNATPDMKVTLDETKEFMYTCLASDDVHLQVIPSCILPEAERDIRGVCIDYVIHVTVFSTCTRQAHIVLFQGLLNSFRGYPFGVLWGSEEEYTLCANNESHCVPDYYSIAKSAMFTRSAWFYALGHSYDVKLHPEEELLLGLEENGFGFPGFNDGGDEEYSMRTGINLLAGKGLGKYCKRLRADEPDSSETSGDREVTQTHMEETITRKKTVTNVKRRKRTNTRGGFEFVRTASGSITNYMVGALNDNTYDISDSKFHVTRPGHFVINLGDSNTIDYNLLHEHIIEELKNKLSVNRDASKFALFMVVDLSDIRSHKSDTKTFHQNTSVGLVADEEVDREQRVRLVDMLDSLFSDIDNSELALYKIVCALVSTGKVSRLYFKNFEGEYAVCMDHQRCMLCDRSDGFCMDRTSIDFDPECSRKASDVFKQDLTPITGAYLTKWPVICCKKCLSATPNALNATVQTKKILSMPNREKCTIVSFMSNISKGTTRSGCDLHESLVEFWDQ